MNLGVETFDISKVYYLIIMFQHSLMNLGVETNALQHPKWLLFLFQHSLMNLGVETSTRLSYSAIPVGVSAFSDESWGGDPG